MQQLTTMASVIDLLAGMTLFDKDNYVVLRLDSNGNPLSFIAKGSLYQYDMHLCNFKITPVGVNTVIAGQNHNGITDEEYLASVVVEIAITSMDELDEVFLLMKAFKVPIHAISFEIPRN